MAKVNTDDCRNE